MICTVPTANLEKNLLQDRLGYGIMEYLLHKKKKTVLLCIDLNLDTTTRESFVPSNSSALTPFFLVEWGGVCVCDDDPSSLVSVVIM